MGKKVYKDRDFIIEISDVPPYEATLKFNKKEFKFNSLDDLEILIEKILVKLIYFKASFLPEEDARRPFFTEEEILEIDENQAKKFIAWEEDHEENR